MASVNKVIIVGNLGRDPKVHYLDNGYMRVELLVATDNHYKTNKGEKGYTHGLA